MSIRETRIVQVADFETDPNLAEETKAGARLRGARANVSVPMLRDGRCLGCVVVGKREPGFFPEQQISLLETFADQAVIAIE
jgi:GAF domain-containing protein